MFHLEPVIFFKYFCAEREGGGGGEGEHFTIEG